MKIKMVLPRYFKWLGLVLFIIGLCIPDNGNDVDNVHFPIGILIQLLTFSGLIMIAAARLKEEDEWVQYMRLNSLQWSILIFMSIRIGSKIVAFYMQDASWLPNDLQTNSLLIIFITIFYTRTKLLPFIKNKNQ